MLANIITLLSNMEANGAGQYIWNLVLQQCIVYLGITLFVVLIISCVLNYTFVNSAKFSVVFDFTKYLNLLIVSCLFSMTFIKFLYGVFVFRIYADFISSIGANFIPLYPLFPYAICRFNGSVLSDIILVLAFSSGMVCVYLLGEKNTSKYISSIAYFNFFYLAVTVMVYTTNLLVMFIGFEMLFLPTIAYAFRHGYAQRSDKATDILLVWTLGGAFLVLSSFAFIYYKHKTLDFYILNTASFSDLERNLLFTALFIGFGVKVPIFPFHYWLTKIHVEAPAGFSIFLSGFLVKAALYCFYFVIILFQTETITNIISGVAFFGILESSVKMWNQTDFKKLIAFATIQEMNLILYLLINCQNSLTYAFILFIIIHGWLSTLMFFLVDIIQRKVGHRNIAMLSGLAYHFPAIKLPIWLIIILFSGFPLTVKFSIEWQIVSVLAFQSHYVMIVVLFIILVVGTVGFVKQMFIILYGLPKQKFNINNQLSRRDKLLLNFIMALLIFLSLIHFFLG